MTRIPRHDVVLAWHLARRDQADRFAGNALGSSWLLIQPLVMVVIFTVVFGRLIGARLALPATVDPAFGYGIYLLSGTLAWTAFASVVQRSATVLGDRRELVLRTGFAMELLPLVILLSESIPYAYALVLCAAVVAIWGQGLGWHVLALPVLFLAHQLLAYGIGLLLATFTVFVRDLRDVTAIVLQVLFWFTPIVYVSAILPEPFRTVQAWSPLTWMVEAYQAVLVHGRWPDASRVALLAGLGALATVVALCAFRALERDVRDFA
jgi:lipopolysaccharide transport system permease protein